MFAQDPFNGYVHEAPEMAGYGPGYGDYGDYGEPDYSGYGGYAGYGEPEFSGYGEPGYEGYGTGYGNAPGYGELPFLATVASPMGRLMRLIVNRGHPSQFPWPLGWRQPELPYTGLGPQRVYMRCAMWPGPRGLVPQQAAAMTPQQQMAAQAQAQARAGGRRRRRRR